MRPQFEQIEFNPEHTAAILSIDKKVYSKSAVLRVCYWFSGDLCFQISESEESFNVTVGVRVPIPTLAQPNVKKIDEWLPDILNALLDSQLRVEIQAETAATRELIIAKAFAESGILEDLPPGTFEDTVEAISSEQPNLIKIDTKSTK